MIIAMTERVTLLACMESRGKKKKKGPMRTNK